MLAHAKKVVALRKTHPALKTGTMSCLDAEGKVLAFTREGEGERLLCVFNLGKEAARFDLPESAGEAVFEVGAVTRDGVALALQPRSGTIFKV